MPVLPGMRKTFGVLVVISSVFVYAAISSGLRAKPGLAPCEIQQPLVLAVRDAKCRPLEYR